MAVPQFLVGCFHAVVLLNFSQILLFHVAQLRTIIQRIRTFQYPESTVFRVVTPCSSDREQRFGRKYSSHLQSRWLITARNQLNLPSASVGLLLCLSFETGSDALLWNVGFSAKYMEVQSGTQYPSQLPAWEPGIQPPLPVLRASGLSGDALKFFTLPGLKIRFLCCPACRQSLYRQRYRRLIPSTCTDIEILGFLSLSSLCFIYNSTLSSAKYFHPSIYTAISSVHVLM
jgi:hypothetical protein